ncbi:hypothetical protein FNO01nite_29310 [Flavobacterium noncentrifugens]|nr:hypothetical protein FNO01nite_29310 [Flavobacterium noncentrifugens]
MYKDIKRNATTIHVALAGLISTINASVTAYLPYAFRLSPQRQDMENLNKRETVSMERQSIMMRIFELY